MMSKKEKRLSSYKLPIKVLWFISSILGLGAFVLLAVKEFQSSFFYLILFLGLLYSATIVYITLRAFRFHRRLIKYFRRLLTGDFSTGIHDISWINDEITLLTEMATNTASHLDTYDRLRADRTALSLRALDVLFRRASRKIIMADMDKSQFKFTKTLQKAFNVDQDIFSFASIENQKNNEHFFRQFLLAAIKDAQVKDFSARLELPVRESALDLNFKFVPIKDKSEKVRIAFLYVDFSENDPVD